MQLLSKMLSMTKFNINCFQNIERIIQFSAATSVRNAGFGRGSGPINLDNVFCRGHEQFLINCSYTLPSPFTDFHFEDAGVTCYNTSQL